MIVHRGALLKAATRVRSTKTTRCGATVVETAIVLPLLFLFVYGIVLGGVGVFRYQAMSSLAREAARYASVHGAQYEFDTGSASVTASNIYDAAIVPQAAGLDLSQLTYQIRYNGATIGADWDSTAHASRYINGSTGGSPKTASVTVTLTYRWVAPLYFGTIDLTRTSEMPITY